MMNRTDRLMAIVLMIQARGACNATELAKHFGTSRRTIYRDIQALSEANVPVYAHDDGYRLHESYFLPPLALTQDEAALLLLGADAIGRTMDDEYRIIAQQAAAKISAILPDARRASVEQIRERLLIVSDANAPEEERQRLALLRGALMRSQTVSFRYFTRYPGEGRVSRRDADPYALACVSGVWFLTAWCHTRQDMRRFRLSRMQDVRMLPRRFEPSAVYRAESAQDRLSALTVEIELLFDEDATPWVMEDNFYYIHTREEIEAGLRVVLHCHHADEVLAWVLGWGAKVRVVSPLAFQQQVIASLKQTLNQYAEGVT